MAGIFFGVLAWRLGSQRFGDFGSRPGEDLCGACKFLALARFQTVRAQQTKIEMMNGSVFHDHLCWSAKFLPGATRIWALNLDALEICRLVE